MMRIPDGYTKRISGPVRVRGRERSYAVSETPAAVQGLDTLSVSPQAFEVQRARLLALSAPEVREAVVDELRAMLDRGQYQVAGADVAPVLIREHLALAGRFPN